MLVERGVESVLEIGPGEGILTKELLKNGVEVAAVEKDQRFFELLNATEKYNEDILTFNIQEWIDKNKRRASAAIVGNIPYNISTPIIRTLLPYADKLNCILLMVQKEFAHKLTDQGASALSLITQLRADVGVEFEVGRENFNPVPKVDSSVISLRYKNRGLDETALKKIEKLIQHSFLQRRKKLRNTLKPFLESDHRVPDSLLEKRPDSLSVDEYIELSMLLGGA